MQSSQAAALILALHQLDETDISGKEKELGSELLVARAVLPRQRDAAQDARRVVVDHPPAFDPELERIFIHSCCSVGAFTYYTNVKYM